MAAIKKFLRQNFVAVCGAAAVALVLGGFAWAFFALRTIESTPLILHFNDMNGITSVGGLGTTIFMGVFGLLVVGMDFAIAREFEKRGEVDSGASASGMANSGVHDPAAAATRARFFARFLGVTTLLFAILLFIAFAAIINVNV